MPAANPYQSPAAQSPSTSPVRRTPWLLYITAALWISLPAAVFCGAIAVRPVYEDFGLSLPAVTLLLMHFSTHVILAVLAVAAVFTIFVQRGRILLWIALTVGLLLAGVSLLAFLAPLVGLWQALG